MEDVVAYLIGKTTTQNAYKQEIVTETRTQILGTKDSVKRSEFYRGGAAGFHPDFVLRTAQIDYNGEDELELDGLRYGIYRTYNVSQDDIELYCEKKEGVQP